MRRILIFTATTAWAAACVDIAAGFRHPVPALAPFAAFASLLLLSFALWIVPVALTALASARPIAALARRGVDRDGLWWAIGCVVVAFAAISTWSDLRRVPLDAHVLREALPTAMIAAWALFPAYYAVKLLDSSGLVARPARTLAALALVAASVLPLAAWSLRGIAAAPPHVERGVPANAVARTNVVLISVDTLRADALSVYSPDAPATPHLERLAAGSLVFEQAVSPASWTKPSLASLQTGLPPSQHGVKRMGDRLDDRFDTLADLFTRAGYVTAMIGFNPYLDATGNLGQGFQDYRGYPRGQLGLSLAARAAYVYDLPIRRDAGDTPALTREAIEFIHAHGDEPFFFWLHYYDPHQPYSPPPAYMPEGKAPNPSLERFNAFRTVRSGHDKLDAAERAWIRALYEGEVRQADANVGEVLEALRAQGLYDDALIVFTSDHGEEFWEHGGFEHGHALFEELLRVPLIVKLPAAQQEAPGTAARGTRIAARVPLEAVYPTILAATGLSASDGLERARPLLDPAGWSDVDRDFVSEANIYYEAQVALTRNAMKYVRSLVTGTESLYDLARDPSEAHSIAGSAPAVVERLRARLAGIPGVEGGPEAGGPGGPNPEIDPNMLRNLKALGYAE